MSRSAGMRRKTRIIATQGPATEQLQTIECLLQAGVDVFRLNMSHGSHGAYRKNMRDIRRMVAKHRIHAAIFCDL